MKRVLLFLIIISLSSCTFFVPSKEELHAKRIVHKMTHANRVEEDSKNPYHKRENDPLVYFNLGF